MVYVRNETSHQYQLTEIPSRPPERKILAVGPPSAGVATLEGCMLFKYGGIDMLTMQKLQKEKINGYANASKRLRDLGNPLSFYTPKHHVVMISHGPQDSLSSNAEHYNASNTEVNGTIFVTAPGIDLEQHQEIHKALKHAKQLIIVINKMDEINWSGEQFKALADRLAGQLQKAGVNAAEVPIIPISALSGDNLVDSSPKCPWYSGWVKERSDGPHQGTTLLEALDISLASS